MSPFFDRYSEMIRTIAAPANLNYKFVGALFALGLKNHMTVK